MLNLVRYGFFSFPAAVSLLTMQVYMPAFLSQNPAFSFTLIGIIFFLARILDTVSDPVIGYLSDNTNFFLGKRRSWLVIATPLFILVFYHLISPIQNPTILFLLIASWYILGTSLLVPYFAWGAEIKNGYKAHNHFTAARVFFGLIGSIGALLIPALLFTGMTDLKRLEVNVNIVAIGLIIALILMLKLPDSSSRKRNSLSFTSAFAVFKKGSHFNQLIISQFFNATANAVPATLFVLFSTHILNRADLAGPILVLYFLLAAVSIPFWLKVSNKWPKEKCWRTAMIIASIVFMATIFVDADTIWLFIAIVVVTGFMAGADLCLPGSMLADLVEIDKNENGKSRSGTYFAFWGTLSKFSLAVAIGITFPLLDLGILAQNTVNTEINKTWLLIMYGFIPTLLKLISVACFATYKLSDEELAVIKSTAQ